VKANRVRSLPFQIFWNSPEHLRSTAQRPPLSANAWTQQSNIEETEVINLYINERRVEAVTIIDLKGRERISGGAVELHRSIRCLADEGKTQILLDLAWVKHIDSTGLGELISSHVTLDDKGGALKLMHMSESVRELMTIKKLLTVFEVYDDEPEAVASFAGETLRIVERQPFFM
jgi:anti-sigma B factor antagonist